MNICFLLPSLARKGPNVVAHDIISFGVKNGYFKRVSVLYFNDYDGVCLNFRILNNVELIKIDFSSKIDFDSFDIVHSHMLKPDFFIFFFRLKNFFACRRSRCKFVTTLHQKDFINLQYDYNSKLKAIVVSLLWRVILVAQTKVVCLSKSMLNYYSHKVMNSNLTYIYNGRGQVETRRVIDQPSGHYFKLGSACLLTKRKGIEQVIKVLPCLPNVQFLVAGIGPELENLKRLSVDLGVNDQVEFLGFVEDTPSFLRNLDAFILPSRGEGFPLAIIEAASYALPIIASNIDVVLEAFDDDDIAIFELDSLDSLLNAIKKVIDNRQFFSDKIHFKYEREFTQKAMFEKYYDLYKALSN
ncbi:glycosyltransferase family 4 protein [Aeromonas veronii]|uniref:glycosyltransferase family 4 protein n=1 Tax=Aeromonas veronii TaxID=654 RepID=UPI0031FDE7A4